MFDSDGDQIRDSGKSLHCFFAEFPISGQFDESHCFAVSQDWYHKAEGWWLADWTHANGASLDEALVERFDIGSNFCSWLAAGNSRNCAIAHHTVKVESYGPRKSIADPASAACKQLQRRLELQPLRIERGRRALG